MVLNVHSSLTTAAFCRYYVPMPRQARLDASGGLHHIMVRGINKSDIFLDDLDRQAFLARLAQNVVDAGCYVYSWALMNNHLHILFKSGHRGISFVMRRQLTWYAVYFNRKYKRTGYLFENRYKSILCEEDRYLLALIRYIHLNPIRAGIVKNIQELDNYPWTGHHILMSTIEQLWMNSEYVLSQFGTNIKRSRKAYRTFMEEGLGQGHVPGLMGGGLLRSNGGWSAVVALKRKGQELNSDSRILGSSDFVNHILDETEEENHQLKVRRPRKNISDIITEQSVESGLSPKVLRSGSRRRTVSRARTVVALKCADELGMTAADIARCLGVNTSTITRIINKPRTIA